jgi:hypothetical protein
VGRRDRGQEREAQGAADLLARVDEPGREPGLGPLHAREGGDRDRHEGEAHADADDQEPGQEVDGVGAVRRNLREVEHARRQKGHAGHEHRLDAEPRHEALRDGGRDDDRQRDGEVADAGLHRREAQHLLHVERKQEEDPEDDGSQAEADHVRARQRAPLEDAKRDERRARARLVPEEDRHQRGRGQEDADRLRRAPADPVRLCQPEHEEHEARRDADGSEGVEVPGQAVRPALTHVARDEGERDRRDGDVDEEDPLPPEVLGEHAAEEHPDGGAGAGDAAEDAERLVPFGAFLERHERDREDGRREDRARRALQEPRDDEHLGRLREPREQRGHQEKAEAHHEEVASAEQVAHAPSEQEEPAEGERIARDDPLEVLGRKAEIGLDRRERHVHDRDVEHDHEVRDAQDRERLPAPRVCVAVSHDFPRAVWLVIGHSRKPADRGHRSGGCERETDGVANPTIGRDPGRGLVTGVMSPDP